MNKIQTRKAIALTLVLAYIGIQFYCIFSNKMIPNGFEGIVGIVIGSYYGKSTALEGAKRNEND